MVHADLKIVYRNYRPYGIRDSGGFLFVFPAVHHYQGQDDRYLKEITEQKKLAEFLLDVLEKRLTKEPVTGE